MCIQHDGSTNKNVTNINSIIKRTYPRQFDNTLAAPLQKENIIH